MLPQQQLGGYASVAGPLQGRFGCAWQARLVRGRQGASPAGRRCMPCRVRGGVGCCRSTEHSRRWGSGLQERLRLHVRADVRRAEGRVSGG